MRNRKLRGLGANQQMGEALMQLQQISDGLSNIHSAITKASDAPEE